MKTFIIAASLFAGLQNAQSEELFCTLSVNLEKIAETQFQIENGSRVKYIDAGDFVFYVANKGEAKFEIEVFDGSAPSRSYAQGILRSASDDLKWSLWTRDVLLETNCKLVQK